MYAILARPAEELETRVLFLRGLRRTFSSPSPPPPRPRIALRFFCFFVSLAPTRRGGCAIGGMSLRFLPGSRRLSTRYCEDGGENRDETRDLASAAASALHKCLERDIQDARAKALAAFPAVEPTDEEAERLADLVDELVEGKLNAHKWVRLLIAQRCLLEPGEFRRELARAEPSASHGDSHSAEAVAWRVVQAHTVAWQIVGSERPSKALALQLSKSYLLAHDREIRSANLPTGRLDSSSPTYVYYKADYLNVLARRARRYCDRARVLKYYYKLFMDELRDTGNPLTAGEKVLRYLDKEEA
ncbi:hypothetical protein AAT19DRAFT_9062 [Rhodotorula toruloides]|uniref:Uncharacterized protein n=1 Tax=Rhodotorula toruloides TaxID=5286 RepID=A0A2T0AJ21_RHOTO|nr:hypothetical protein AAT19DRAFT_9062 [Rhodotorula toruloides]